MTSLLHRLSSLLSVDDVIGLSDMMECPSQRLVKRIVNRCVVFELNLNNVKSST